MARDEAYYRAERKIERAQYKKEILSQGSTFLFLKGYGLSEVPDSLKNLQI